MGSGYASTIIISPRHFNGQVRVQTTYEHRKSLKGCNGGEDEKKDDMHAHALRYNGMLTFDVGMRVKTVHWLMDINHASACLSAGKHG